MVKEHERHYKIFGADTQRGESDWTVKREAYTYARRLRNLGFKAKIIKGGYANPVYDVVYYRRKRMRA